MRERIVLDQLPARQEISVPAHAERQYVLVLEPSANRTHHIDVILEGAGAQAEVFGLFVGHGEDAMQLTVNTIHEAPATRGHVRVDAVLAGSAQFDFFGNIKILPAAQQADGGLYQHTLLLSEEARASAVPALEIEANDVRAFHAATAAPVDAVQRFFLQSRGLSEF